MIKYHFFGRELKINRNLEDRKDLAENLKIQGFANSEVLFLNQIHGCEAVIIDNQNKIYDAQNLPKADAIVTNLPNVNIAIITADCTPILMFDVENKIIAAAHAGWRGAKSGVIENAVLAMKKLGAKNISAILGPTIQQNSYEVSKEFLDEFLLENSANKKFFKNGLSSEKYLFDLPGYAEEKLINLGIKNIQNDKIDTYQNSEKYFSFRRSTHLKEPDCGRNVSVIAI
jgi:YfiH family protein